MPLTTVVPRNQTSTAALTEWRVICNRPATSPVAASCVQPPSTADTERRVVSNSATTGPIGSSRIQTPSAADTERRVVRHCSAAGAVAAPRLQTTVATDLEARVVGTASGLCGNHYEDQEYSRWKNERVHFAVVEYSRGGVFGVWFLFGFQGWTSVGWMAERVVISTQAQVFILFQERCGSTFSYPEGDFTLGKLRQFCEVPVMFAQRNWAPSFSHCLEKRTTTSRDNAILFNVSKNTLPSFLIDIRICLKATTIQSILTYFCKYNCCRFGFWWDRKSELIM